MQFEPIFETTFYRIRDNCKAYYPPNSPFFIRHDSNTLELRFSSVLAIQSTDLHPFYVFKEVRLWNLYDVTCLIIELVNPTELSCSIFYMFDPFEMTIQLIPIDIQGNFIMNLSENGPDEAYLILNDSNRVYYLQMARRMDQFEFEKLQVIDLQTDGEITALEFVKGGSGMACFIGTNKGIIETLLVTSKSAKFKNKLFTKGPVSHLVFKDTYLYVAHGGLEVNHANVPILEKFQIQGDLDIITPVNLSLPHVYPAGVLTHFKVKRNEKVGDLFYLVFETMQSNAVDTKLMFDVFGHNYNFREEALVETAGSVLDIEVLDGCFDFKVLFAMRSGLVVCPDNTEYPLALLIIPEYRPLFGSDQDFVYTEDRKSEITRNRSLYNHELLVDKLLKIFDINPLEYPPVSPQAQERLANTIYSHENHGMNLKHCLIYYLLKDHPTNVAERFAKYVGLSRPFILAVNGFWAIDNKEYDNAVTYLADPSVDLANPADFEFNWHEKIVSTLFKGGRSDLALEFITLTSPSIWNDELVDVLFECMQAERVYDLITFQRKFPRPLFLQKIFDGCFKLKMDKKRVSELLYIAFTNREELAMIDYCESCDQAHDFLLTFYISRGRYTEAIMTFEMLFKDEGTGNYFQRKKLMESVMMLLPPVLKKQFTNIKKLEPVVPRKDSVMLSQSDFVRRKDKEEDLMLALKEASIAPPTPNQAVSGSVKGSPAVSPFVKPPFTPRAEIKQSPAITRTEKIVEDRPVFKISPFVRDSPKVNAAVESPALTPIVVVANSPVLKQQSPSPALISRSPFVSRRTTGMFESSSALVNELQEDHSTDSIPENKSPYKSISKESKGTPERVVEPPVLRRSPRVPKRMPSQTSQISEPAPSTPQRSTRPKKKDRVATLKEEVPMRRTPPRTAKKKEPEKKRAPKEPPTRTVVTRRMLKQME